MIHILNILTFLGVWSTEYLIKQYFYDENYFAFYIRPVGNMPQIVNFP